MIADALSDGRRLLQEGRLVESAEAYRRALLDPATAAAAHYGLGMVALEVGDPSEADVSFHSALALDRSQSNAAFQIGMIAERGRDIDRARAWYGRAIEIEPSHVSARARLEATSPQDTHATPSPLDTPDSPGIGRPGGPGILTYLLQDNTPISRQTIELMDQLDTNVRPRFIAYLGRYAGRIVIVALLVTIATAFLVDRGGSPGALLLVPALSLGLGMLVLFINVRTTHIRISQGRLQIERGILRRYLDNVDLWRVLNVNLEQTFLNRITGDGTLDLILSSDPLLDPRKSRRGARVRLSGLASGPQLRETQQALLNLAFLLRGNPVVKGIIQ